MLNGRIFCEVADVKTVPVFDSLRYLLFFPFPLGSPFFGWQMRKIVFQRQTQAPFIHFDLLL